MTDEVVQDIAKLDAPFGREILCQDIVYDSGLQMMRIRIREGNRFTILDIDPTTATEWSQIMLNWSSQTKSNITSS
jgi:hypothetical protein